MSERIIDMDRSGGAIKPIPCALIRFNTEAATPGNATVALRLAAPGVCIMNWGDGNTELIRPEDFTLEPSNGTCRFEHVYATAGIYNTVLITIGALPVQLKHALPGGNADSTPPFDPSGGPPNLATRIELPAGSRGTGYEGFVKSCTYLTSLVIASSVPIGSRGSRYGNAFSFAPITTLPPCSFPPGADITRFCAWAGSLANVTALLTANTANVSEWQQAFINCTSLPAFPAISLAGTASLNEVWRGCTSMTSFGLCTMPPGAVDNMNRCWAFCTSLTSFPLMDFSRVKQLARTWEDCSGLTSFPLIVFSSCPDLSGAWQNCSSLTSFPLLNTAAVTNFSRTWYNCSSLTSFPLIDTSAGTNFREAWQNCTGLTGFPAISTASATNMRGAWKGCTSLANFPAGVFDNTPCLYFGGRESFDDGTFSNCTALTQTSINNIYSSINTAGTSNGTFRALDGVIQPNGAGLTARNAMISRGWTINHP